MGEVVTFKMYRSIWGKGLLSKCTGLLGGISYFQNIQEYVGRGYFQNVSVLWGKQLPSTHSLFTSQ